MKIAILVNVFPKISETFILNQVVGLIDRGHEIHIFSRTASEESVVHRQIEAYDLRSKISHPDVPHNKFLRLLPGTSLFVKHFPRHPIRLLKSINFVRYGRDALSLRLLYSAVRFDNADFDLIFCHFGPNGNLGALLTQTGVEATLVTMFHGSDVQQALNKRVNPYGPAFNESDVLLVNSNYNKDKLIDIGASPEKLVKHPIGVDTETFQYRWADDSASRHTHKVIITTVGRLAEEKGYEYALRAIRYVQDDLSDLTIEYHIVGGGPQSGELHELVDELNISDIVHFHGAVEQKRVSEILSESHLFLLASISEGFGKVLVEAQAVGLPIVATNVGGIPEAVNRQESALLVPPRDPTALAEQILYLCDNQEIWPTMGKTGRQYVKREFDIHRLNDQLEQLFQDLIADH